MAGSYPFVVRASQETMDARQDFELRLAEADKLYNQVRGMLIELSTRMAANEAVERDYKTRLLALETLIGEKVVEEPHAIREALQYLLEQYPDVIASTFRGLTKVAVSADARVSNDFAPIGRLK